MQALPHSKRKTAPDSHLNRHYRTTLMMPASLVLTPKCLLEPAKWQARLRTLCLALTARCTLLPPPLLLSTEGNEAVVESEAERARGMIPTPRELAQPILLPCRLHLRHWPGPWAPCLLGLPHSILWLFRADRS